MYGTNAGVRPTSAAQYAAWSVRQVPEIEAVRDDVWAIPVPVAGNPIRFTYAYLIAGADGAVLIDPGAESRAADRALAAGFSQAGVRPQELRGIVITHFHFDHWQGADRLARRTGAWIGLSAQEWAWIQTMTPESLDPRAADRRFREWGAPPCESERLAATEDYGDVQRYGAPSVLFDDADVIRVGDVDLEVLITPGHSPGHLCLVERERGLLFSGDHLLPGISPHIALNPFGPEDPIAWYVASLERLRGLSLIEVLPAHEFRFAGLEARIDQLREGIQERLREVGIAREATPGAGVWGVATALSWSRPWESFGDLSRRMAIGETAAFFAHIDAMRRPAPDEPLREER